MIDTSIRSAGLPPATSRRRPEARPRVPIKCRVFVEPLEQRTARSGLLNGVFSITNPSDPNYGWTSKGNASNADGEGILDEGTTVQTGFF
jgi:hypothetical protein